jgi:hypothetical protein
MKTLPHQSSADDFLISADGLRQEQLQALVRVLAQQAARESFDAAWVAVSANARNRTRLND